MNQNDLKNQAAEEIESLLEWINNHKNELEQYIPEGKIEHEALWGSSVIHKMTVDIKKGNEKAVKLACELIKDDEKYPFGKILKSNIARALKHQVKLINPQEKQLIINTTKKLLTMRYSPRETEDYCKLVAKFKDEIDLKNEFYGFKTGQDFLKRFGIF